MASSRDVEPLANRLKRFVIDPSGPTYSTGFHCYDFSIEQCARWGESECRVVELGGILFDTTGHAVNTLRTLIPGTSRDVYCLYDPQYAFDLKKELCWTIPVNRRSNGDMWGLPEEVLVSYCKANPKVCNRKPKTYWNSWRAGEIARKGAYAQWWENDVRSNGQVLRTCHQLNREENMVTERSRRSLSFPGFMPKCEKNDSEKMLTGYSCSGLQGVLQMGR